jgi:hypothetical protein
MAQIVEEKEFPDVLVTDKSGKVIFNGFQQDDIAIRRKYDDGEYDVLRKSDGRLILPKYNPEKYEPYVCIHCGKEPW